MTKRQSLRLARALLWITPALWSTNYLIARPAAGTVGAHQLAFGRWTLALALMLPFTWAALAEQPRAWLREWPRLLVLGALGMWICGAFVYRSARMPVSGDPIYGGRPSDRLMLHAWKIAFEDPDAGTPVEVEAELPADILAAMEPFEAAGDYRAPAYEELVMEFNRRYVCRVPRSEWPDPLMRTLANLDGNAATSTCRDRASSSSRERSRHGIVRRTSAGSISSGIRGEGGSRSNGSRGETSRPACRA